MVRTQFGFFRRAGHPVVMAVLVWSMFAQSAMAADSLPVKIGTFPQEIAHHYTTADGLPSNDILSIAIGPDGSVYAGTAKGLAVYQNNQWSPLAGLDGKVWIVFENGRGAAVAENTLYQLDAGKVDKLASLPSGEAMGVAFQNDRVVVLTDRGVYRLENNRLVPDEIMAACLGEKKIVHQLASEGKDKVALGAETGLYTLDPSGAWQRNFPADQTGRSWAVYRVQGTGYDRQGRLWFASPQGAGCLAGETWTLYTGKEGLPYNDFTTLCCGPDGSVWFGTSRGAIRFDGTHWAYREGPRWLPDNQVRSIAVADSGEAWIATTGGVGRIERRPMTLAEKAAFYEDEMEKYIRRTEYGYVSEVHLKKPGDKSEIIYSDSDNDGLWTSMYGAGECFAYAATKDPQAKDRAKRAFEALRFLSVVTQGGEVKQQPGFVARTVLPTTEPDPNKEYTIERMKRAKAGGDSLWKVYYPRWPRSADGKYWYKTDTSSDELDGHYFFYPAYYDLVADTDEEKERVRELVRGLTDHLLRNDYCLVDHDGTPTRWAIYSPAKLNHDPNWYVERGLKSLSILSYLTVAEHITGDVKYAQAIETLCRDHAFDTNAMVTKIQRGVGSGNQSDDEMAIMNYYNLIKYTKDETLRLKMLYSFYKYWILEYPEMNPFFNFAYAAVGLNGSVVNPWGTFDIAPWEGWLEDSIATLKGFPLDRLNWPLHNSHRLDLVQLQRQAALEPYEPMMPWSRGYRVNGKVLPVEERHFNHWNTDPWHLDYGGNGQTLAGGTVFLLPYYMGLYHGFIAD